MIPVILFNASTRGLNIAVNSAAPPVPINGTNGAIDWYPGSNLSAVQFAANGPAPNLLAPGPNQFGLTPIDSITPVNLTLDLPDNPVWTSVQVYVFTNANNALGIAVLYDGQYVTGAQVAA